MTSNLHLIVITGLTLLAGGVHGEDRMPWAADFNTACGMAAEQRRLVLLHFYNDNCGPCVRVEQNVFSKPEVADAVSQNYVAVKVHAGKNPQLATKYHVNQWPTDVFVTASGLEVFRTVSPQKPTDYITVLNQVATHAGVGSGRLANNPLNSLAQAGAKTQAAIGAAAGGITGAFAAADQRVQQTTADAQRATAEAQQKWNAANQQVQNTVNQTQATATSIYQQTATAAAQGEQHLATTSQQAATTATAAVQNVEQQATTAAQQATNTVKQWESQATTAIQGYEQQAATAYQQARDRATQTGQQIEQQAETTKQQWQTTVSQTAKESNATAQNLKQQASALGSSLLDRRSAFMPVENSPAAAATPATTAPVSPPSTASPAAAACPAASPTVVASPPAVPTATQTASTSPPPALTSNPYVASKPAEAPQPPTPPAQPSNTATNLTQAYSNATAAATAVSPTTVQASALVPAQQMAASSHQMVPVSQAPPVGLDGFCPVTLVDTMTKNPSDRNAWKKGDRRFGAIHKGRTYLFTSAENQQKFLQNPDAYAPVLSGCDPVAYTERGQMVDGKRAFGLVTGDRHIYLFADEASRSRFEKSPAGYTTALQQAAARNNQSASIYR